jgi:hypothetical protein
MRAKPQLGLRTRVGRLPEQLGDRDPRSPCVAAHDAFDTPRPGRVHGGAAYRPPAASATLAARKATRRAAAGPAAIVVSKQFGIGKTRHNE